MDAVEKALGHYEGPWFMQQYGLVDITFVPFLERIVASIPYYKVCSRSGVVGMTRPSSTHRSGSRVAVHSVPVRRLVVRHVVEVLWTISDTGSSPRSVPKCCVQGMRVRGGGRFPNLDRWFEALEQRPAYVGTRSDYFTHVHDLPPQIGGGRFQQRRCVADQMGH